MPKCFLTKPNPDPDPDPHPDRPLGRQPRELRRSGNKGDRFQPERVARTTSESDNSVVRARSGPAAVGFAGETLQLGD